jgi:hypothetical protein
MLVMRFERGSSVFPLSRPTHEGTILLSHPAHLATRFVNDLWL